MDIYFVILVTPLPEQLPIWDHLWVAGGATLIVPWSHRTRWERNQIHSLLYQIQRFLDKIITYFQFKLVTSTE